MAGNGLRKRYVEGCTILRGVWQEGSAMVGGSGSFGK